MTYDGSCSITARADVSCNANITASGTASITASATVTCDASEQGEEWADVVLPNFNWTNVTLPTNTWSLA
jgi:hypothetical protein